MEKNAPVGALSAKRPVWRRTGQDCQKKSKNLTVRVTSRKGGMKLSVS